MVKLPKKKFDYQNEKNKNEHHESKVKCEKKYNVLSSESTTQLSFFYNVIIFVSSSRSIQERAWVIGLLDEPRFIILIVL
jgi:hypothetical protein